MIIATRLAALFAALPALAGGHAYAVAFNGTVLDFQQQTIYRSPETPGYTEWVGLWQMPNGTIQANCVQFTGPADNPVVTYPRIDSFDGGQSWSHTTDCVRMGGRGLAVLPDGTLVRPQRQGDAPGYVQRSTDGGQSWTAPIPFVNQVSQDYTAAIPTVIHRLSDGRLALMAGTIAVGDPKDGRSITKQMFLSSDGGLTWGTPITIMPTSVGACEESDFCELPNGNLVFISRAEHFGANGNYLSTNRVETILTKSGETFVPQPSTIPYALGVGDVSGGFPCLLYTKEGVILDLAMHGDHYSNDNGATWHDLQGSGPDWVKYYPQAVQTADGTIVGCCPHAGRRLHLRRSSRFVDHRADVSSESRPRTFRFRPSGRRCPVSRRLCLAKAEVVCGCATKNIPREDISCHVTVAGNF